MIGQLSIFFDFNLPNATTWFYFSWFLAMALFFKFSRLLSVRNWDVVALFLLVPGFLLLQEGHTAPAPPPRNLAVEAATLVASSGSQGLAGLGNLTLAAGTAAPVPSRQLWFGYLWLLCGSLYFFLRCLGDLTLVRRPALAPDLNFGGLAWLAVTLSVCLIAVAFRYPGRSPQPEPALTRADGPVAGQAATGRPAALDLAEEQLGAYFWMERAFAVLCHLSVVVGLIVIGRKHFQDAPGGMAAATFYLMLPYTGQFVGQLWHVWPMALMIWGLVAWRRPTFAGVFLGLAAGTVFFPALLLPIWIGFYRGRGVGRFCAAFLLAAGVCLAATGMVHWLREDLAGKLQEALSLSAWQPWQMPTMEGFWTGVHWAYRMPVFIAYLAFLLATAFWPAPKNLAHVIALSAAALIGLQFWYADQGGIYVLWYLPLLLLLVFRPNLADRRPGLIQPETDWLTQTRRRVLGSLAWLLNIPEPAARIRG